MEVRGWSEHGEEDVSELGTHFMNKLKCVTNDGVQIKLDQDPDSDHVGTTTWDAAVVLSRLIAASFTTIFGGCDQRSQLRIIEV